MSWTASQRDRGPSSDGVAAAADELEEPAHLGLELQRRDLLAVEAAAQFIRRVACPREHALRRGRAGDAERRQPREQIGRASGRDRVWQYVWISMGAGQLK